MLSATLWFTTLTGLMDLGEISSVRVKLMVVWTGGGVLMTIFVPGFFAATGTRLPAAAGAALVLDAVFLVQTSWRYVLTLLAYYWVIAGMVLVYSPHLWRDAIHYVTRSPQRRGGFHGPAWLWPAADRVGNLCLSD